MVIILGKSEKRTWYLDIQVDESGSAEVWRGNLEQEELCHVQNVSEGLTKKSILKKT